MTAGSDFLFGPDSMESVVVLSKTFRQICLIVGQWTISILALNAPTTKWDGPRLAWGHQALLLKQQKNVERSRAAR